MATYDADEIIAIRNEESSQKMHSERTACYYDVNILVLTVLDAKCFAFAFSTLR